MKQFLAIPLIFVMLVKPLWPVAEYIINYDYIVTNLCENRAQPQLQCDGKCYLSKLLAKENGQQEDNPFENNQQNHEVVLLHYYYAQYDFNLPSIIDGLNKILWPYMDQKNTSPLIHQPTPPPEYLV